MPPVPEEHAEPRESELEDAGEFDEESEVQSVHSQDHDEHVPPHLSDPTAKAVGVSQTHTNIRAVRKLIKSGKHLHVKVLKISATKAKADKESKDAGGGAIPTTTVELEGVASYWGRKTLKQLRFKLQHISEPFNFCEEDGAVISDDMTLATYFKTLHTPLLQDNTKLCVYICPVDTQKPPVTSKNVFSNPPFLLKFVQLTEEDTKNEGSVHSSSLNGNNPGQLRLVAIRRLIKTMSVDSKRHHFCLKDGTDITDDVSLEEYIAMSEDAIDQPQNGISVIKIFFHKTGAKTRFHAADQEVVQKVADMGITSQFTKTNPDELERDKEPFNVAEKETLDAEKYQVSSTQDVVNISKMDENDWFDVIRNCNLMFGWRVDINTNSIVRAPKPAFKLRSGVNMPKDPPLSDRVPPRKPIVTKQKHRDVNHPDFEHNFDNFVPPMNTSDEDEDSDEVDDDDDFISETDESVVTEAIQRHKGTGSDTDASHKHKLIPTGEEESDDSDNGFSNQHHMVQRSRNKKTPSAADPVPPKEDLPVAEKNAAFPSFIVTDSSKIEVTSVTHEFQRSMAANHFTSTSVEANASGGFAGWSASASAAAGSESSQGTKESQAGVSKIMVASYKIPRVTMYLMPEDLEPTEEFKGAIELIRRNKNVNDLRKLHTTFGQLFCQEVILGGCLQTSKFMEGVTDATESVTKEKFKAAVGVAVSTPFGVGGGVKAEHETSDSKSQGQNQSNTNEGLFFEATGGNTILASNPSEWCSSVIDFHNWRAIEQSQLMPLVEIVSQIAGYTEVREWFMQAIPTLSKYIVIPDSRTLDVRLRACMDQGGLSRISGSTGTRLYLAHDHNNAPSPIHTRVQWAEPSSSKQNPPEISNGGGFIQMDITTVTTQVVHTDSKSLFSPSRTQAPVLFHYNEDYFGQGYDPNYEFSVWKFEVPEGYSLSHGSRVIVKCQNTFKPEKSNVTQSICSSLTIYRNQQGEFLPAMTTNQDPAFWRVMKVNGNEQEEIKDGEAIRLVWCFSDQRAGFRDFFEDSFGRRRFNRPDNVPDLLYLKVPYPRFEDMNTTDDTKSLRSISLIMSAAETTLPILAPIKVRPAEDSCQDATQTATYNLHDLVVRLDSVGNQGRGESEDYMMANLEQKLEQHTTTSIEKITHEKVRPPPPAGFLLSVFSPFGFVGGLISALF